MTEQFKKYTEDLAKQLRDKLEGALAQEQITSVKAAGEDNGTFKVIVSTADVDRHGESINIDGWNLDHYKKNAVVLWAHDHWEMPIGITDKVGVEEIDGKRVLVAEGRFAPATVNPFAQQVRAAYDAKILTATSVGLIVHEMVGNEITKQELLEFSFVPIPANPNVADLMKGAGLDVKEFVAKGLMNKDIARKETDPIEDAKVEEEEIAKKPADEEAGAEAEAEAAGTEDEKPAEDERPEGTDDAGTDDPAGEESDSDEAEEESSEESGEDEKGFKKTKTLAESVGSAMNEMQNLINEAIVGAGRKIQDSIAIDGGDEEDGKAMAKDLALELIKSQINSATKLASSLQELYRSIPADNTEGDGPQDEDAEKVEETKELDAHIDNRRVLRLINGVINSSLEDVNKKIKAKS